MSVEQNKNILRRMIDEGFNQGQVDVLDSLLAPDLVEHQFGLQSTVEGQKKDIQFLHTAFPDFHLTIEEIIADGDKVWARMIAQGTNLGGFMGPPNGKPFKITVFDVCRIKDGKIIEHWGSPDRFALLAQLDMLPKQQKQMAQT